MPVQAPNDADLLALEEQQLYHFMTDVRPVGEEKSELYDEPAYFHLSWPLMLQTYPEMIAGVRSFGTEQELGARNQRILGRATGLHMSGTAIVTTWGREMWLTMAEGERDSDLIAKVDEVTLTEADAADAMRFAYDWGCAYRQDGWAYPSRTSGLGADYKILPDDEAAAVADAAEGVDGDTAQEVLGLYASIRALSFLMEAETRDALMMHGPYPAGENRSLIFLDCSDLRWSLFAEFPIPGGQRWQLPDERFPHPNLSIAIVVEGVSFEADRFGTLYADTWTPNKVVAASLFTRGEDEWSDGELKAVPLSDVRALRHAAEEIQEQMFLQLVTWDARQRVAAGHFQKGMFMARVVSGAGADFATARGVFDLYKRLTEPYWDQWFEPIFERGGEMPFYLKLNAFVTGESPHVLTPYSR
ncbi:MAG TPA: hypothetical protein VFQ14_04420 [Thermoleophilaceae bacterium]|nr:hypothetical protein [Thermoleophilaceae bacterium]